MQHCERLSDIEIQKQDKFFPIKKLLASEYDRISKFIGDPDKSKKAEELKNALAKGDGDLLKEELNQLINEKKAAIDLLNKTTNEKIKTNSDVYSECAVLAKRIKEVDTEIKTENKAGQDGPLQRAKRAYLDALMNERGKNEHYDRVYKIKDLQDLVSEMEDALRQI